MFERKMGVIHKAASLASAMGILFELKPLERNPFFQYLGL